MNWIRRHARLIWAAALMTAALIELGLSVFRDYWTWMAAGESDIAARGGFIFFGTLFVPVVAVSIVAAALSVVVFVGTPRASIAPSFVGAVAGVLLWLPLSLGYVVTAILVGNRVSYLYVLCAVFAATRIALPIRRLRTVDVQPL